MRKPFIREFLAFPIFPRVKAIFRRSVTSQSSSERNTTKSIAPFLKIEISLLDLTEYLTKVFDESGVVIFDECGVVKTTLR